MSVSKLSKERRELSGIREDIIASEEKNYLFESRLLIDDLH